MLQLDLTGLPPLPAGEPGFPFEPGCPFEQGCPSLRVANSFEGFRRTGLAFCLAVSLIAAGGGPLAGAPVASRGYEGHGKPADCCCCQDVQADADKLPPAVVARLRMVTPVEDELLYDLERDYLALLKQSPYPLALLEAEQFMDSTNDNSTWTHFRNATAIIRRHRDKAAVPLLLRYMVLHAERSSAHIIIPEYSDTVAALTGHRVGEVYESGPELPARVRAKVAKIVNAWWGPEKESLVTDPAQMDRGQLEVLVDGMIKRVRDSGHLEGSGGAAGSAYRYYHVMYYGVMTGPSEPLEFPELHPDMLPLLLKRCGPAAGAGAGKSDPFAFEVLPVLAELRRSGKAGELDDLAGDPGKPAALRLASILAIFQAGEGLRTSTLLELLDEELTPDERMVALLALRYGGPEAVPVLLKHLEAPNLEVCMSAAGALQDSRPREALPLLDRRVRQAAAGHPWALFLLLGKYENVPGRKVLAGIMRDSLEGTFSPELLDDALSALQSSTGQRWTAQSADGSGELQERARHAIAWLEQHIADMERQLRVVQSQIESVQKQQEIARGIESLRQAEFERLLALQADGIATPGQTTAAGTLVEQVRQEIRDYDDVLRSLESLRDTLKAQLN